MPQYWSPHGFTPLESALNVTTEMKRLSLSSERRQIHHVRHNPTRWSFASGISIMIGAVASQRKTEICAPPVSTPPPPFQRHVSTLRLATLHPDFSMHFIRTSPLSVFLLCRR